MRKILLSAFAAFTVIVATAQTTLFSESFTGSIPGTWTLINNDGHTPAANVSWINNAWVWGNTGGHTFGNVAVSTSWYDPAAASDDWMITPQIIIPSGSTNVMLLWDAVAVDDQFPDGYQVKLSTTAGNTVGAFDVNLLTVPNETADAWTTHNIDLTSYAGDTITLAWINNSNDQFILLVDNIKVMRNVPNYNIQHVAFDSYIYLRPNENTQLIGDIANLGFQTVNSFKLNYSVNGSAPISQTIQGLAIAPYTGYHYTFPNNYQPTAAGTYNVKMWASDINGANADSDHSNDTLLRVIQAVTNNATKKAVFEEFTGAWCGYCPDGHLKLTLGTEQEANLIAVSIHSQNGGGNAADRMNTAEGDIRVNEFAIGFPSGVLDAVFFLDESDVAFDRIATSYTENRWLEKTQIRLPMATPANVSLVNKTYDTTTRELSVTVRADFLSAVQGDYRLNLYITEDSVVGNGSGYDQHNYYSSQTNGGSAWSGSPYVGLDDPIVGWNHNHVLRKAVGGAWGTTGIIPATVAANSTYTKTYTYTLPNTWRNNYISLIGMVEEYNDNYKYRNILNAEEVNLMGVTTGINEVTDNLAGVSVYPNPATNLLKIGFELKENANVVAYITNALGQKIADLYNGSVNTGAHTLSWYTDNVANGIYFVTLKTGDSEVTKRFVVNK